MAVLGELQVRGGTRQDAEALATRVEERLEAAGGPPDGLFFLCVHPSEDGFRVLTVFRSEDAVHAEVDGHLRGDAAAVGIDLGELTVSPVWDLAMPGAR